MASACAVCGGRDFVFLARERDYTWEECRACRFVRIATAFTLAEAAIGEGDAAMGRAYIAGYRAKFASKMARSRRRAARLRRRAKGKDFLDVGSNFGFMVEAAEGVGFRAVGVEVNRILVDAAREQFPGRTFVAGLLEEQHFGERRFDVVYCSEVIEHTADPRLFLTQLAQVMRPGALLYLTTPHIREYRRRGFAGMGAPDHKLYFNDANLRRLLQECGFADVRPHFTFFRGIKLDARRAPSAGGRCGPPPGRPCLGALRPVYCAAMTDGEPHLLVVDDDARLRELLRRYLAEQGFRVTTAADAAEARAKLASIAFDLLVLDVMLPGEDGMAFTRSLRRDSRLPILLLTAMAEPEHRINGLEGGADDYLAKPFEPRELVLRIRNILQRVPQPSVEATQFRFGACRLDLARGELFRGGDPVHLTTAETALLVALARRAGEAVSREDLSEEAQFSGNVRTVDVQVTRLRRKIERDPKFPRYLQTVRGTGYVLKPD